jgi:hypothetical protein
MTTVSRQLGNDCDVPKDVINGSPTGSNRNREKIDLISQRVVFRDFKKLEQTDLTHVTFHPHTVLAEEDDISKLQVQKRDPCFKCYYVEGRTADI